MLRISCILDTFFHVFFCLGRKLRDENKIFTHLSNEEKRTLYTLACQVRVGYSIEIGSYLGASSCFIAAGLDDASKLICIDTWENDAMSEGKRDTYEDFMTNTSSFREKIVPVQGYSTHVLEKVKSITPVIDMLFIDGDHSYEGVKADWDAYFPLLREGATVVLHDYGWADGVQRVVHEDILPRASSFSSLPNMWWGVIGEKQ